MIKRGGETQSVIREREGHERRQRLAEHGGDTENGGTAAPPSWAIVQLQSSRRDRSWSFWNPHDFLVMVKKTCLWESTRTCTYEL